MPAYRVEIAFLQKDTDSIGKGIKADINEDLGITVQNVSYIEVYSIDAGLGKDEVKAAAERLFSDPLIQEYSINNEITKGFDWVIEVKLHSDVTDNTGMMAEQAIADVIGRKLKEGESIRCIRKYGIKGKLDEAQVARICSGLLANSQIETFSYKKMD
jgi:phosphoribosylformylglycinamidine (FGAM) synthase PurS component